MTTHDKLQYARARLALAKLMNDVPEITKWQEHVEYWQEPTPEQIAQMKLDDHLDAVADWRLAEKYQTPLQE